MKKATRQSMILSISVTRARKAIQMRMLPMRIRTGDWSTYKYYIRALGPGRMLLFLLLVSVNETFTGLESRFFSGYLSKMMLTRCRCLAKLVGIEQRQWRRTKARLLAWNVSFMAIMTGLTLTLAICLLWVYINPRAGSHLHRSLLEATVR